MMCYSILLLVLVLFIITNTTIMIIIIIVIFFFFFLLLLLLRLDLVGAAVRVVAEDAPWLRTNGVNTNGAAAEVMNIDRLGKKVRPVTFGEIKVC